MTKKIAVYNNKGGVGKSTFSTQISHGLSKLGFKVLLINLDGQNDSITFLGIDSDSYKKTLYDLFDKRSEIKISECIINTREGLDVIPSSQLHIIESEFNMEPRIDLILKEKFADLEKMNYDYIIIDCGPQPGKVNSAILCYVDKIIIPVQLELASVKAAGNVYQYLKELRLNPNMIGLVIPNMHDKRVKHTHNSLMALRKIFDDTLLTEPIPERAKIKDAGAYGKSIFEYDSETAQQFLPILERLVTAVG